MLPPDQQMILNLEHTIPATSASPSSQLSLSGYIDYTAVVANLRDAGKST